MAHAALQTPLRPSAQLHSAKLDNGHCYKWARKLRVQLGLEFETSGTPTQIGNRGNGTIFGNGTFGFMLTITLYTITGPLPEKSVPKPPTLAPQGSGRLKKGGNV